MLADWSISDRAMSQWQRLVEENWHKPLPSRRRARNVHRSEDIDLTPKAIWRVLIGCQVTTQQRSGPNAPATRFLESDSPALSLSKCRGTSDLPAMLERECREAGLRRSVTIASNLTRTLGGLQSPGAWKELISRLETLKSHTTIGKEREVVGYLMSGAFPGLGHKQARNCIQWLGLSRYEVPLDSRVLKRLREFGATFVPAGAAMTDEAVYLFVQCLVQQIAKALNIYPCELDACIFASFGDEEAA